MKPYVPKPHPRGWPIRIMIQNRHSKEDNDQDCVANWFAFHTVAIPPDGGSHCHWIPFACPPYNGPPVTEAHKGPHWDHVCHAGMGGGDILIPWSEEVWLALCKLQDAAKHLGRRLKRLAGSGDVGLILDDAAALAARISPNNSQCSKCGGIDYCDCDEG